MFALREILEPLGITEGEVNSGVALGTEWRDAKGRDKIAVRSPIDGELLAEVSLATKEDYEWVVKESSRAFKTWREVPAPKRGEIILEIVNELKKRKKDLGKLVSVEVGKIIQEGMGEVQEMIDIGVFAAGLSRQLYGPTMQSERVKHRLYEQWHPLGPVGVITAFNFPAAVWSWNAFIAAVCGDTVIWKPSTKAPLTAIAIQKIVSEIVEEQDGPKGVFSLVVGGGSTVGNWLCEDRRIPLISFTGSVKVGKNVAEVVSKRLGRTILELGGNNAAIVMEDADFKVALKGVLFGALATAGQRCTTTRRLILHEEIYDEFLGRLIEEYKKVKIGNPLEEGVLIGPLIDEDAVKSYFEAIERAKKEGGKVLYGGERIEIPGLEKGHYVKPTIIEACPEMEIVKEETFAPILYVFKVKDIEEAIEVHNSVPQGLSSAIFTNNLIYAEKFLSAAGSDCGIANVNTSTAGAEIGGAFGGEKETGGGREAGSDAWKNYMRRQTVTINWSGDLPLAQGIRFGVE